VEDSEVHRPQVSRHPLGGAGGWADLLTAVEYSRLCFLNDRLVKCELVL
jgi:hypothetical protein